VATTIPSLSCLGLLLRRDACGFDRRTPGFDLACDEATQILRGAMLRRRQRRAEFAQTLLHRCRCHGRQHRSVELGDDGRRRRLGRKIAFQLFAEKPLSPCSSAVAMSGNAGERSLPSTAGAATAWLCSCAIAVVIVGHM